MYDLAGKSLIIRKKNLKNEHITLKLKWGGGFNAFLNYLHTFHAENFIFMIYELYKLIFHTKRGIQWCSH